MDVLFVNPGNSKQIYQGLADDYSAIETPTWSLLLAQSCRSVGYSVGILDVLAERLTDEQATEKVYLLCCIRTKSKFRYCKHERNCQIGKSH